ncbi:DUF58 domain-containing protein [Thiospirillum jenense]|uniref:DUF58 domain-containing protein n=1 Tax=Thiospirillum jenense TaxID=1653858 RepID=A0A839HPN7_9GAMM|nr:DUF58 domain-containing protein [Thiospirillum jenense]MBB1127152.1 DUF58 domain-containing protein [Thiospirillum jenense]
MSLYPRLDDLLELRHQAHTLGVSSHHLVNSTFAGLYASVFRGAGINFEEVRDYYEGDDVRYIDWKVTARTHKPHLKVFREERERSVVICVDKGPHMNFGTRITFKSILAARAAALIGWAASRLNDRVGGMVFGDVNIGLKHFRPARGRRALWQLLRTLTLPTTAPHTSIDCLAGALAHATRGLSTGSLIFIIADFNREVRDLEYVLGDLTQRHSVVLLATDDPSDWDIPAMGWATFAATNGELLDIDTDDPTARRQYRLHWEDRRAVLIAMARRLNLFFLPLRTDQEVHKSLIHQLRQRMHMRAT